jgi:hypothetical protein
MPLIPSIEIFPLEGKNRLALWSEVDAGKKSVLKI